MCCSTTEWHEPLHTHLGRVSNKRGYSLWKMLTIAICSDNYTNTDIARIPSKVPANIGQLYVDRFDVFE